LVPTERKNPQIIDNINDGNILHSVQLQKEVKSNPKQLSCKNRAWPQKGHCEIQGGSQGMAVIW